VDQVTTFASCDLETALAVCDTSAQTPIMTKRLRPQNCSAVWLFSLLFWKNLKAPHWFHYFLTFLYKILGFKAWGNQSENSENSELPDFSKTVKTVKSVLWSQSFGHI